MPPPVRNRRAKPTSPHINRRLCLLLSVVSPLLLLTSLYTCASVIRRANSLGRRCMPEPPEIPRPKPQTPPPPTPRIAMVSFSEEEEEAVRSSGRWWAGRRSFQGLMETVGGNKRAFAARMGYDFIDAGDLIDPSRPPSWSKIPAVRSHLPGYDWVFWNDADTVVTNSDISLENILQAVIGHADFHSSPDLVVTEDNNGINAGVFFVRRSAWSEQFLDTWWNQTSFVRFGMTKSGDNDAMKHLIDGLTADGCREHIRVSPMQCLFNSYPWFPTWKSFYRLISSPRTTWKGAYSDGDFMVHLAGLDEKKQWAAKILREMKPVG